MATYLVVRADTDIPVFEFECNDSDWYGDLINAYPPEFFHVNIGTPPIWSNDIHGRPILGLVCANSCAYVDMAGPVEWAAAYVVKQ